MILEKVQDRVLRKVLWSILNKKGITTEYVKIIQNMHDETRTSVKYIQRNGRFYGKNRCLLGVDIEFVFAFTGNR